MGSQRSIFLTKTDQSLMGILWVAKGKIFLIKTDQSLIGILWVAKGQIFLAKNDVFNGHSMGSQMSNISNKN